MSGMLDKKSSGAYSRWQPRFFAICGHNLEYAGTAEKFKERSRGVIDLHQATACEQRGRLITLKVGTESALELQAEGEETAAAWRAALGKFVDERMANLSLKSLDQFGPRKGSLLLGRKGGSGRKANNRGAPGAVPAAAAAAAVSGPSGTYDLATLQAGCPADIDPTAKHLALSDADFEASFQMSKDDFATLPKWKQTAAKKATRLF
jgi:hypothetical protein